MRLCKITFLALALSLAIVPSSKAIPGGLNLDTLSDYRGWGWDVLLVNNEYITLAIVPSIGGRVLQYDLGVDTFMIVNEALFGQTFYSESPTPYSSGNWGYGGYKTWPAPQSEWNWTPPPVMAWGNYDYEVLFYTDDSLGIWMKGQTEQYQTPGLRFDRYMTIYNNSTHVKVTTVMFNDNASPESWSIWDVTQTIVNHPGMTDFSNIAAYIPIASPSDIWVDGGGPSYEEVLPGIYKIQYINREGKMLAMSSEGWTCWVDERDEQCYAKLFEIKDDESYPENGTNVFYYTNGTKHYMEMEVAGPLEEIGPDGADSIVFTEDWYVTSTGGPMYTANDAGVVLEPVSFSRTNNSLHGEVAVFNEGNLKVFYKAENGGYLGWTWVVDVTPNDKITLDNIVDIIPGTTGIVLNACDAQGNVIGSLGDIDFKNDDDFVAYKAPETPTIDGLADEAFWDTTSWYNLDWVWLPYDDPVSPEDFTGKFKLAWDENFLYILVQVVDDSLYDSHPDPLDNYWNDDCVEVFLDEDHSGGNHLNSYNAFAYHIGLNFDVVDNNDSGSTSLFNDNVTGARTKDGDTYTWELAIKVFDDSFVNDGSSTPVTLENNKVMGFSLAYCDTDGSPERENFIGSKYLPESESNNSYIDASIFGTLTLIDPAGGGSQPEESLDQKNEALIRVFPNPAEGTVFFSFGKNLSMDCKYELRNVTGQLIESGTVSNGQRSGQVDISGLSAGMYLLNFVSDQVNISKQIIVR